MDHLTKVHSLSESKYIAKFPGGTVRVPSTLERRRGTVQARYGVGNVFQAEAVKKKVRSSLLANHGVTNPAQSPGIRAKTEKTNLERYGASNPFGSTEVQERIRQSTQERFGVDNPNQSPEVMARRIETNQGRYGASHFLETGNFKEKTRATSLERYGTNHPMQSEEVQNRVASVLSAKYGKNIRSVFELPEMQARAYASSVANHGGVHHLSHPDIIEARKKRLLDLYGVDNISKVPAIKEKIISLLKSTWGSGAVPKMNNLERAVSKIVPDSVVYTGDWSYWVTWSNGVRKNPDFVVLAEGQLAAYRAGVPIKDLRTHLVIEVNGDFWHTTLRGLTREQREVEFINGYASVGVHCLVLWEGDFRFNPDETQAKVLDFILTPHEVKVNDP